jgi:hypothetical protein
MTNLIPDFNAGWVAQMGQPLTLRLPLHFRWKRARPSVRTFEKERKHGHVELHINSVSHLSSTTPNRLRVAEWDQLILRKGLYGFAGHYLLPNDLVYAL